MGQTMLLCTYDDPESRLLVLIIYSVTTMIIVRYFYY